MSRACALPLKAGSTMEGSGSTETLAISVDDVREAAARIAGYAHVTPVHTCSSLDAASGRQLFFKCETFQKT